MLSASSFDAFFSWHKDCRVLSNGNTRPLIPELFSEGVVIMEFRHIVCLTLWTLLIGPILDFGMNSPKAHHAHSKHVTATKNDK